MAASLLPGVDDAVTFDSIGRQVYDTLTDFIEAINIGSKNIIVIVEGILEYALVEEHCQNLPVPLDSMREQFEQIITLCKLLQALCESAQQAAEPHKVGTIHKLQKLGPDVVKHFCRVWVKIQQSQSIVRIIRQHPEFRELLQTLQEMVNLAATGNASTPPMNMDGTPSWESLGLTWPEEIHVRQVQPPNQDQQQNHTPQDQNCQQQQTGFLAKLWGIFINCAKELLRWLSMGRILNN